MEQDVTHIGQGVGASCAIVNHGLDVLLGHPSPATGSFLSIAWDWGFSFDAALCIPELQY
jgi:hypothetical protein